MGALLLTLGLACSPGAAEESASAVPVSSRGGGPSEVEPVPSVLAGYDFEEPVRRFDLPGRLDEVSGLALTSDGRLLAHDDERGRVHEIDPMTGEVGKHFDLGVDRLEDDFEGIAVVGEDVYMVSSAGRLYAFREGADEEDVPYRMTDTLLGADCEVEGLDHDPTGDALVLACKSAEDDDRWIVVHRVALDDAYTRLSSLRIDRSRLDAVGLKRDFAPSAILALPGGGFLLASAVTESLLEVDGDGVVRGGVDLRKRRHPQPEGIAMGADGTLYLADEENERDAWLTAYAPRGGGGR